jgi:hypothetical protein
MVLIGGSALLALGLVNRTTKDVDIVAIRSDGDLESADPLPDGLVAARDLVARWSRSHDPSPGYAEELRGALEFLGVSDVDLRT